MSPLKTDGLKYEDLFSSSESSEEESQFPVMTDEVIKGIMLEALNLLDPNSAEN